MPGTPEKGYQPPEFLKDVSKKKERMTLKDWWTIILSTLAFGISAAGFYINNLLLTDDLIAIVSEVPQMSLDDQKFSVEGIAKIAFINAGNGSAAILALEVWVSRWMPGKRRCQDIGDVHSQFIEPFVVEPGKIAIKDFKVRPMTEYIATRMSGIPTPDNFYHIDVCMKFQLETPASRHREGLVISEYVKATDNSLETNGGKSAELYQLLYERRSALSLWWKHNH